MLVHANKAVTGIWPYGILSRVDQGGLKSWVKFVAVQVSTLCAFIFAMWVLAHYCCELRNLGAFVGMGSWGVDAEVAKNG